MPNQNCCLKSLVLLGIISLMVGLSGCGDYQSNVESGNLNGTLHWGNGTEPQSLTPHSYWRTRAPYYLFTYGGLSSQRW